MQLDEGVVRTQDTDLGFDAQLRVVERFLEFDNRFLFLAIAAVVIGQREMNERIVRVDLEDAVVGLERFFLLSHRLVDLGQHAVGLGIVGVVGDEFLQFGHSHVVLAHALIDARLGRADVFVDAGAAFELIVGLHRFGGLVGEDERVGPLQVEIGTVGVPLHLLFPNGGGFGEAAVALQDLRVGLRVPFVGGIDAVGRLGEEERVAELFLLDEDAGQLVHGGGIARVFADHLREQVGCGVVVAEDLFLVRVEEEVGHVRPLGRRQRVFRSRGLHTRGGRLLTFTGAKEQKREQEIAGVTHAGGLIPDQWWVVE